MENAMVSASEDRAGLLVMSISKVEDSFVNSKYGQEWLLVLKQEVEVGVIR
jgi:hypothetical protein